MECLQRPLEPAQRRAALRASGQVALDADKRPGAELPVEIGGEPARNPAVITREAQAVHGGEHRDERFRLAPSAHSESRSSDSAHELMQYRS